MKDFYVYGSGSNLPNIIIRADHDYLWRQIEIAGGNPFKSDVRAYIFPDEDDYAWILEKMKKEGCQFYSRDDPPEKIRSIAKEPRMADFKKILLP